MVLEQPTVKQHRQNILDRLTLESDSMDWDFAIDLALEWNATDEKWMLIQDLGLWNADDAGVDSWVDTVEALLELVLADICGEGQ